jgi:hypothetical protein
MFKWLLAAWVFVPGGCWVLACAIVRSWQQRASQQDGLRAGCEESFEELPDDRAHFFYLGKTRVN